MTSVNVTLWDAHGTNLSAPGKILKLNDLSVPYKLVESWLSPYVMSEFFSGFILDNWRDGGITASLFTQDGETDLGIDLLSTFHIDVNLLDAINALDLINLDDNITSLEKIHNACMRKIDELNAAK